MTKVKVLVDFYDLELKKAVKALDEYEVSDARAKELSGTNNKAGRALVEIVKAPVKAPVKKEAKR